VIEPAQRPALRGGVVSLARRRWVLPSLAVLLVLGLLIGVGGHRLYTSPTVDHLAPGTPVDAVVALGGLPQTAAYAQSLVEQGAAPVLVLSDPYKGDTGLSVHAACASRPSAYRLVCFTPDPSTTRGEAREIQALARANGWHRVAVVAPTFHISRARLLVRRCYPGTLLMLALPTHVAWDNWTYQYVRQTLGYAKAAVLRSC
jgi:uncharacterized SAM-binding protein YcdF (DUF218 family)